MNRVLDIRVLMLSTAVFSALATAPQKAEAAPQKVEAAPSKAAKTDFNPRARLTRTVYNGRAAWRLSDGRTEAIVVPEISRVMAYRFVGGQNMLWNSPEKNPDLGGWKNWGGDKNWFAPQSWWSVTSGAGWPPDKAWDGSPFQAEALSGARLRTTSPVSKGIGARIIREYALNANGELEIKQTAEKVSGAPLLLSIWNISQTQPDAIYLPLNPQSVFKNKFFWFDRAPKKGANVQVVAPNLLRVIPIVSKPKESAGGYKIGVDARTVAIVAVKGDVAFVEKSNFGSGAYLDGPENSGFPVELYDSGDADAAKHYIELELLTPLRPMRVGSRWQNTLRWNLQKLRSSDPNAPATHREIARLMPTAAP